MWKVDKLFANLVIHFWDYGKDGMVAGMLSYWDLDHIVDNLKMPRKHQRNMAFHNTTVVGSLQVVGALDSLQVAMKGIDMNLDTYNWYIY